MAGTMKYNPDYHDDWAWSLAAKGATDDEIAEAFGISVRTVNRWKNDHLSFRKKIETGKMSADAKVEASLFRRALGYEIEESENLLEMDADGNRKPLRVKKTKKHVAPDTMAAMYWLNNRSRKSGDWTQRQDVNVRFDKDEDDDVVLYIPDNGRGPSA